MRKYLRFTMSIFAFVAMVFFALTKSLFAQDSINPYTIHQACNIILQNTDVYYNPFDPPDSTDTREELSCLSEELCDSNGVRREYPYQYRPKTHGVLLKDWAPHGTPIGELTPWQRFFTAMRKSDGTRTNITVGSHVVADSTKTGGHYGNVTISKNEDVDFRASGSIRMRSGFRVKPGAFFHAYIEPTWGDTVLNEDFKDTTLANWYVGHGWGWRDVQSSLCSKPENVHSGVLDTDAFDHSALQIDLRHDTCNCIETEMTDNCGMDTFALTTHFFAFSNGSLKSCTWPYAVGGTPTVPSYTHMPYGRWEIRQKIPHVFHHTDTYGDAEGIQWNLNETDDTCNFSIISPYLSHPLIYGPFHGYFVDSTFRSPEAHFTTWNRPRSIVLDGFGYEPDLQTLPADTFMHAFGGSSTTGRLGGFPSSVTSRTGPITFTYTRYPDCTSDNVEWSVTDGRFYSGEYGIDDSARTLFFNKGYQPVAMDFLDSVLDTMFFYNCHWDHTTGKIRLDDTLSSSTPRSGIGIHHFRINEMPCYPQPYIRIDTQGYKYHTYTMEFFPHECHFLIDGAVVLRFPDRLVPRSDLRYDYVSSYPRVPLEILPAAMDWDGGTFNTSYFLHNVGTCEGCWDSAAHARVDYMKVWDIPPTVKVRNYIQ